MEKSISELATHTVGLQQQKITFGATFVDKEQETKATIHMGSPNLDNKILGKHLLLLMSLNFC